MLYPMKVSHMLSRVSAIHVCISMLLRNHLLLWSSLNHLLTRWSHLLHRHLLLLLLHVCLLLWRSHCLIGLLINWILVHLHMLVGRVSLSILHLLLAGILRHLILHIRSWLRLLKWRDSKYLRLPAHLLLSYIHLLRLSWKSLLNLLLVRWHRMHAIRLGRHSLRLSNHNLILLLLCHWITSNCSAYLRWITLLLSLKLSLRSSGPNLLWTDGCVMTYMLFR